ncbi:hypothetical protein [Yersinia bercovieri]|uniref:hypothetical protein n=1 Tax=Yersinia bercovieri TaxID=634 RepID=UPI001CFEC8E1|nr:hypothetical protein [Yersinia bercovieri]MCB5301172.1 hypothetical protein [Yersinia bercovieri]
MNTIEIKVSVDTGPIDSLITKLERAVELQKQLTPTPLPTVFAVDTGQTYSLRAGIHIDSFILGGAVRASKIESSPASIKELQDNVAAIITNASDTRHQLECIDHQRNKDFVSLSKAVRSVEESISRLSHRDSFIG